MEVRDALGIRREERSYNEQNELIRQSDAYGTEVGYRYREDGVLSLAVVVISHFISLRIHTPFQFSRGIILIMLFAVIRFFYRSDSSPAISFILRLVSISIL